MTSNSDLRHQGITVSVHTICTNVTWMYLSSHESERSCICVLEVMYLCVRGHIFVWFRLQSSQIQSFVVRTTCDRKSLIKELKRNRRVYYERVYLFTCQILYMYLNTNVTWMYLSSHESERSCICVLEVMYLCVRGHIFVC
jgi:hypothetical protein